MKTIQQALIDEIHYPLPVGFIENKLTARGLEPEEEFTALVATGKEFVGAVADCLYSLIYAPNFSEADKSFSLGDREIILRKVNSLYNSIGEPSVGLQEKPVVYIGG